MQPNESLPYLADFHERMSYVIQVLKENKNSFAKRTGVNASIVANMVGGRLNKPSIETVEKISKAYPKLNLIWLIMGQGKPFVESRAELATEEAVRVLPPDLSVDAPVHFQLQTPNESTCWPKLIEAQQRIIDLQDQLLRLKAASMNVPQTQSV